MDIKLSFRKNKITLNLCKDEDVKSQWYYCSISFSRVVSMNTRRMWVGRGLFLGVFVVAVVLKENRNTKILTSPLFRNSLLCL